MENFLHDFFTNSKGVFEGNLRKCEPIKKVKLKDIDKYEKYLAIDENRIYLILFDDYSENNTDTLKENSLDEYLAETSAKFLYITKFYNIKFKPLIQSFYEDEFTNNYNENDFISVYSKENLPKSYYQLYNKFFENTIIISHIIYRIELNLYISKLKKITNPIENFDLNNLTW
jgi:hypothetical protein